MNDVPPDDILLNELAAALAKAQGAMNNAILNRINPHFKSKYADLAALWDAVRKPLSDNGLSVVQIIRDGSLHTMLLHTSGQRLCSDYPLPPTARPQEMGSALTYARRYSLSALVGIAADEDDDANAAPAQPVGTKRTPKDLGSPDFIQDLGSPDFVHRAYIESADVHRTADAAPATDASPRDAGAAASIEDMAREASMRGEDVFDDFYKQRSREEKTLINVIGAELRKNMKLTEAYKHGQQAKADGHLRRAIPPEYREPNATRFALCWQAGFDGQAMPEFNQGERDNG